MRVRRAALGVLGVASLSLAVRAGIAYRFFPGPYEGEIASAATAPRWKESDFPLQFRLLENDLHPPNWNGGFLRSVIEEGFADWSAIPTSTFRVELSDETLVAGEVAAQGISEIGFSTNLGRQDRRARAEIHGALDIYECDIPLHPERWDGDPGGLRRSLKFVVMHELGHCLGLAHTEEYPMADWVPDVPSTFFPPPVMAYAWTNEPQLAEDDRIGASLLYPTPDFARSFGAVGGQVLLEDGPARFVYVQAFTTGSSPEAVPGTFTDENGKFLLEGLRPGSTLLWMHPLLPNFGDPHSSFSARAAPTAGRSAIQDQWRWVNVRAGQTVVIPSIMAVTGRRAASR